MMAESLVLVEKRDSVGLVTFNRPAAHNALSTLLLLELERIVSDLDADDAVKAIVFTGAGEKSFVAGADIAEMQGIDGLAYLDEFLLVNRRVFNLIEHCLKPTVAAINGLALGGGAEIMLCMDMRVAADSARIGFPEINLGIFPGGGGTQRLVRQLPLCRAKELMLLGDWVTAQDAREMGLINSVVPKGKVLSLALEIAARLAEKPPLAIRLLKSAVLEGEQMPPAAGLAFERALFSLAMKTADANEGLSAFVDKRSPVYQGK